MVKVILENGGKLSVNRRKSQVAELTDDKKIARIEALCAELLNDGARAPNP